MECERIFTPDDSERVQKQTRQGRDDDRILKTNKVYLSLMELGSRSRWNGTNTLEVETFAIKWSSSMSRRFHDRLMGKLVEGSVWIKPNQKHFVRAYGQYFSAMQRRCMTPCRKLVPNSGRTLVDQIGNARTSAQGTTPSGERSSNKKVIEMSAIKNTIVNAAQLFLDANVGENLWIAVSQATLQDSFQGFLWTKMILAFWLEDYPRELCQGPPV